MTRGAEGVPLAPWIAAGSSGDGTTIAGADSQTGDGIRRMKNVCRLAELVLLRHAAASVIPPVLHRRGPVDRSEDACCRIELLEPAGCSPRREESRSA